MHRNVQAIVAAVLLGLPGGPSLAQAVEAIDGDNLRLGSESLRLWGIDAPEDGTPEGDAATRRLAELVAATPPGALRCERMYLDRYGRTVGRCTGAGRADLACELVRSGHARDWPRYSGGHYKACEP